MSTRKRLSRLLFAVAAAVALVATPVLVSLHAHSDTAPSDCSICHRPPSVGVEIAPHVVRPAERSVEVDESFENRSPASSFVENHFARGPPA
ncbi:MAG: hypothetical protein HYY84_04065 [Deltaproteobacteria bacterium]|nr:hypothetical protein [Deltaproteobacteria bacterium]